MVSIPVDDVVRRRIEELKAKLREATLQANNNECDAVFWQRRCEQAERERDALKTQIDAESVPA